MVFLKLNGRINLPNAKLIKNQKVTPQGNNGEHFFQTIPIAHKTKTLRWIVARLILAMHEEINVLEKKSKEHLGRF